MEAARIEKRMSSHVHALSPERVAVHSPPALENRCVAGRFKSARVAACGDIYRRFRATASGKGFRIA
jgi:hypothetical protein